MSCCELRCLQPRAAALSSRRKRPVASIATECAAMLQQHPESKVAAVTLCKLQEQDAAAVDPAVLSKAVDMLLEKHPDVAHGYAGRARELLAAGGGGNGGGGGDESTGIHVQASELLERALALDKSCLTALIESGMHAAHQKEWMDAAEHASRGLAVVAALERGAGGRQWWDGCKVGLSFLLGDASLDRLHTQSQAEHAFNQVLALQPSNPRALAGLAEAALLQDAGAGAARAEELATAAMAVDDASHLARTALGWSKFLRSDFSEAERLQREAIAADGTRALYHLRLGRAMWSQEGKKRKESLKVFMQTAKLDPNCSTAFTYLGHHYVGSASTVDRATRCYEKAVLLEPLDSEAGEALFKLYANAGKTNEVVQLCQRVTDAAFGPFVRTVKWAWLGLGTLCFLLYWHCVVIVSRGVVVVRKYLRQRGRHS